MNKSKMDKTIDKSLARQQKEKAKLKRIESNSMDEEEFQDCKFFG